MNGKERYTVGIVSAIHTGFGEAAAQRVVVAGGCSSGAAGSSCRLHAACSLPARCVLQSSRSEQYGSSRASADLSGAVAPRLPGFVLRAAPWASAAMAPAHSKHPEPGKRIAAGKGTARRRWCSTSTSLAGSPEASSGLGGRRAEAQWPRWGHGVFGVVVGCTGSQWSRWDHGEAISATGAQWCRWCHGSPRWLFICSVDA